jgi:hypothetical protein
LRRAVLTKPIGRWRSTAPNNLPSRTINANGSNANTRNNPKPAQVSQYRGASSRSRIRTVAQRITQSRPAVIQCAR